MGFGYINQIGSLIDQQRLHFYELLAHNLTITVRGIWFEPDLSDAEKLDRIYWVNEILHRITAKVYTLRLNLHEWTEADSWKMIQGYIGQKEEIEQDVLAAIRFSYNSAVSKEKIDAGDDA